MAVHQIDMDIRSVIISIGSYVPDNIIANADLKQFPAIFLPRIEQKTGVKYRRFADSSQCTSDLAIMAARRCLEKAQYDAENLDGIILATSSPDRIQPATATRVQYAIGATRAFAFDVNSVCSGGVYALQVADAMIRSGAYKHLLVIAAEIYSKYLDPKDFSTFPYFGDGAAALLLSSVQGKDKGIIKTLLRTDGSKADVVQIPAGGTMLPLSQMKNKKDAFFKMIGREVFNFAVDKGTEVIEEILSITNTKKEAISYVILHQANINIIKEICRRLEIDIDKFQVNLDKYGNTAAASVFITLDELVDTNIMAEGDIILLAAFGGGLSWGASLIRI